MKYDFRGTWYLQDYLQCKNLATEDFLDNEKFSLNIGSENFSKIVSKKFTIGDQ